MSPERIELTVYPGKNGPDGNSNAPIKSPNPPIKELHFGPNQIADNITGINPKLIRINGVFIETNLASTISIASKRLASTIFFTLDIKKSPFFLEFSRYKERRHYISSITIAECKNIYARQTPLALITTSRLLGLNDIFSTLFF